MMIDPRVSISGMTPAHFEVFRSVAKEMQRYIVVRNTNRHSTYWIGLGYPPKPKELEALKTGGATGMVTARSRVEQDDAREIGFYVLDAGGTARGRRGRALACGPHFVPAQSPTFTAYTCEPAVACRRFVPALLRGALREAGQVLHPRQARTIVGDYDLMGVFSPTSTGSNLSLAASDGKLVANRTNPRVDEVSAKINAGMDQPRVQHGPQDMYKSFRGACTAFEPDGSVRSLSEKETKDYYASLNRKTSTERY